MTYDTRIQRLLPSLRNESGFTLVELLVSSSVGALIIITASLIIGPHLRSNQRMEAYTRLQERWVRVAYLLDTEIQSASNIAISGTDLILTVPIEGSVPSRPIIYKLVGTQLLRNGPPIDRNGLLVDSNGIDHLVLDGVAANGFTPAINDSSSNKLSLAYSIRLVDPNSGTTYTGKSSVARGKADCDSLESEDETSPARGPCN